jgi:hypothetical protein
MTDWREWHQDYERADSPLARRLEVVRRFIAQALDAAPRGRIRVTSMCAGDGRDILGVVASHARGGDVVGRLVELDPDLCDRASSNASEGIQVMCADASITDAYLGATPADLLLACGVFGNVSVEDVRRAIGAWPMLCAAGATVIWTRGASRPDLRPEVRRWVIEAGFEEVAFEGAPERYGVGVARMTREPAALVAGLQMFQFLPEKQASVYFDP